MTAETTGSGAALFLAADGAVLKNIRVSGTAKANGSAAGIAAQAKNTQFRGCVNEAAVTSTGEKAGARTSAASRTAEPSAAGPMTPCRGPTRRD